MNPAPPAAATVAVIDTNVTLDLLLFRDARVAVLDDALRSGRLRWMATPAMRAELAHVITRPALARYHDEGERILTEFDKRAESIDGGAVIGSPHLRCRDVDDQPFVDLAFHLRPSLLLSHDRDLLVLARRARALGVDISSPAAFERDAVARRGSPV